MKKYNLGKNRLIQNSGHRIESLTPNSIQSPGEGSTLRPSLHLSTNALPSLPSLYKRLAKIFAFGSKEKENNLRNPSYDSSGFYRGLEAQDMVKDCWLIIIYSKRDFLSQVSTLQAYANFCLNQ